MEPMRTPDWRLLGAFLAASWLTATACATSPEPPPEPPLPPGRVIVIQPGETLAGIARETGVSVDEIVEVNGLRSADAIVAGQSLFIPAPAGPRQAPPGRRPEAPTTTTTPPTPPTLPTSTPTVAAAEALLSWPVDGVVLRDFVAAGTKQPVYEGILMAAPAGTEVLAARDGVVAFAGTQGTRLGTLVVIDHGGELVTIYGHLGAARVKAGQKVARGAALGVVGTSGLIGVSPRVYFEVRQKRVPVDPLTVLPPS
jgi:murein DD-endopeptidase MepM/ murein hydrolase activator NlpD